MIGMSDFGVVVHGPEAVYSGELRETLKLLERMGSVRAVAGGTMCRAAIMDEGLEGMVDISVCDPPSRALSSLQARTLVLVNHGKTIGSGIAFGDIVAGRVAMPLVHVERAFANDGMVIEWGSLPPPGLEAAERLAANFRLKVERMMPSVVGVSEADGCRCRTVRCVRPGEPLFVNGNFIGIVRSPVVRIYERLGKIEGVEGVDVKRHGLERLGPCDIMSAMVKSGSLRERTVKACLLPAREGVGSIAVIDHAALSSLERVNENVVCALTIGDDTTEVAGDVLARIGVRVIGITDGDLDGLLSKPAKAGGSVVFRVHGLTDDEAGAALAKIILGRDTFEGFVRRVREGLERMGVKYEACRDSGR